MCNKVRSHCLGAPNISEQTDTLDKHETWVWFHTGRSGAVFKHHEGCLKGWKLSKALKQIFWLDQHIYHLVVYIEYIVTYNLTLIQARFWQHVFTFLSHLLAWFLILGWRWPL